MRHGLFFFNLKREISKLNEWSSISSVYVRYNDVLLSIW